MQFWKSSQLTQKYQYSTKINDRVTVEILVFQSHFGNLNAHDQQPERGRNWCTSQGNSNK